MTIRYRYEKVEDAVERIEISHKEIGPLTELPRDPLERERLRILAQAMLEAARTVRKAAAALLAKLPSVANRGRAG